MITEITPTEPVRHRDDCTEPRVHWFRGKHGDQMIGCASCRRYAPIGTLPTDAAAVPITLPSLAGAPEPRLLSAKAGSWRCREHPEQPVTWRGRGCQSCAKAARRKKTRNGDTDGTAGAGQQLTITHESGDQE